MTERAYVPTGGANSEDRWRDVTGQYSRSDGGT